MKKQDVNIKKSRLINVQISLIAILCFGYWMYEVYAVPIHKDIKPETDTIYTTNDGVEDPFGPFEVEPTASAAKSAPKIQPTEIIEPIIDDTKEVPEKIEKDNKKELVVDNVESTDNNTPTKDNVSKGDTKSSPTANVSGTSNNSKPLLSNAVDMSPVYPGCSKFSNNKDIMKCFESKIQRLVKRRFNNSIGADLGLDGIQRINVYFEIDKQGNITNIKARGKHKSLEKEARRVAKLLPKMSPAMKNGKNVTMSYVLPISLDVR